jgi:osmotically-inducible protein OsmY
LLRLRQRRLEPRNNKEDDMKTDTQLHRDMIDELAWDPSLKGAEIGVAVKDGVVTLTGQVDSYAQKFAADRAAERVGGVRAIAEDLEVRLIGERQRTDTEIAHAVVNALKWDVEVPDDRLKVKVEKGFVTVEGNVDWHYQKDSAERAVRYLTGVRGVTNRVIVTPKATPGEVRSKIESALVRSAQVDAKRITVEAVEGKVTLKGKVRSWAERQDAERAAWGAPGVREVRDDLLVAP